MSCQAGPGIESGPSALKASAHVRLINYILFSNNKNTGLLLHSKHSSIITTNIITMIITNRQYYISLVYNQTVMITTEYYFGSFLEIL